MRPARGFTMVEVACACGLAALLAGLALPAWQGSIQKSRRNDAVAALSRLQSAEERMRAHHGLYSDDFAALQVPAASDERLYALSVQLTGAESYRATATATGAQAADRACPVLTLDVTAGFATYGPQARCWNR